MGVKRATAAIACGVLATAGSATAVVSTEAQQPGPPTGTLQLMQRDRDARFQLLADVRPRQGERGRPTPGDSFMITGAVRDEAGKRAGRVQALFVVTNARREDAQVSATFIVRGGHIAITGADTKARVDHFAVTGGTGRYTGARGTLRVTEGRRSTAFLFTFLG